MARWRVAGINFEHFHMGDNLRMVFDHEDAEIVGIADEQEERMVDAALNFGLESQKVFTDWRECLEKTKPNVVLLCPATAGHGEWTQRIAPYSVPILMEKPFAANLEEADTMIGAMEKSGQPLAINWPLAWYPAHRTAKRLVDEGRLGDVLEVHFYDGNRGPLWHSADKVEKTEKDVRREKPDSWFYKKEHGGGALLDYLGYGTTLGTWYLQGRRPIDVTGTTFVPPGLEVDEHAIIVARYDFGLSKFETRWGTFTDPWTHQPQPKCGFVLVGTEGTLTNYDFENTVRLQTREHPEGKGIPVDEAVFPLRNPVEYFLDCLAKETQVEGPLSVPISRIGQQIVDTAFKSAEEGRTLPLIG